MTTRERGVKPAQEVQHPVRDFFSRLLHGEAQATKTTTTAKEEFAKRRLHGDTAGVSEVSKVAVGGAIMTGLGIATAVAATTYFKAVEAAFGVVQYTYLFQGALLLFSGFMLAMGAYGFWLGYKEAQRTKWK